MSAKLDFIKMLQPLTGSANWPTWKRRVRDLIDNQERALDVIDGSFTKPEPQREEATPQELKEMQIFRKANCFAKSVLTSTITEDIYNKVMEKETAREVWLALHHLYQATTEDQLFKVGMDFFQFSWSHSEDVAANAAKLRRLWNELNAGLKAQGEETMPELFVIFKLLQVLPHTYQPFKTNWLLKDVKDKSSENFVLQLCSFERNVIQEGHSESQEAFNSESKHKQQQLAKSTSSRKVKKSDICNYCKKKGHWVKDCKKWITDGKPPRSGSLTNTGGNPPPSGTTTLLAAVNSAAFLKSEQDPDSWWIDNGATRHVTNTMEYFATYTPFVSQHSIRAAGQEVLDARGKGTIYVTAEVNGNKEVLLLTDVWYVPDVNRNLFSVLASQDKQNNSVFKSTATDCWLSVKGKTVLQGSRSAKGTLYKAHVKPFLKQTTQACNTEEVHQVSELQLYHERWGHQDKKHIQQKLQTELGICVPLTKETCEACIYGKSHRKPFGIRESASKPGELVCTDVCGPFPPSFQKARYLVIFKDAFTKFRYGYILKQKSDVSSVLKQMLAHAKAQGHVIKEMLSDNGGEFDNNIVRGMLEENGITQRLTAPYTPQQNGMAERDLRTVVELARTLKYSNAEVVFPEAMWAELVRTAIYLLNRTGKSSVHGLSPYEQWMQRKPRIKHLRIIASTCFAHIPKERRKKLDKKAVKGYLIGYDGDERYRVWIPDQNKIELSRDVTFHENIGSFAIREAKGSSNKADDCSKQRKLIPASSNAVQPQQTERMSESEEKRSLSRCNSSSSFNSSTEIIEPPASPPPSPGTADSASPQPINRKLRNRLTLKRPDRFGSNVMEFIEDECNEQNMCFLQQSNPEMPLAFQDAVTSKYQQKWRNAMNEEFQSLQEN